MTEEKPKRGALLYYQLASVILLLVLVGFSISGLWGLVKMVIPKLTTESYEWKMVSTFDRYVQDKYWEKDGRFFNKFEIREENSSPEPTPKQAIENLKSAQKSGLISGFTREQVEAKWLTAQGEVLDDERREGLQMIMLWFVVVLVCLPLYLYHHKAVKKGRQAMEQASGQ